MSDPTETIVKVPVAATAGNGFTAVSDWHTELQEPRQRGDRAALRRAQTVDDAYGVVSFHRLLHRLAETTDPEAVARLAIVLAGVERDRPPENGGRTAGWGEAFGRAVAASKDGKPCLSEDRLRLLLSAEDPDQFLRLLRGAVHLLDGTAPLADLARVVLAWHRPDGRPRIRRQIFLSYFATLASSEKSNV